MPQIDNCSTPGRVAHNSAALCALFGTFLCCLFCSCVASPSRAAKAVVNANKLAQTKQEAVAQGPTTQPSGDASAKGYVQFDFPPGVLLAQILYPRTVMSRDGKTKQITDRTFARSRFWLPKSTPLHMYLKYDSLANMKYIEQFKACKVTWLDAANLDLDDKHLVFIRDFKELMSLDLYGTLITDKSLPLISSFKTLVSLKLSRTGVTGEGFKYFTGLKHLNALCASNIALKRGTLSLLKPCSTSLTYLDIGRTRLSKEDAAQIQFFPNLTYLDMSFNNDVDNDTAKLFTRLPKLKVLHIEDSHINEQCLPILFKLPKLELVYVRNRQFWHSGKPPAKTGRIKFVDVGTTEDSTLELLAPLH